MKRIPVPLLDNCIFMTDDIEDARAFLKRHGESEDVVGDVWGVSYVFCDSSDRWWRMLCVFDNSLQTIVHESTHAAWDILESRYIKVTPDNDEVKAFLVGWLVSEFCRHFPYTKLRRNFKESQAGRPKENVQKKRKY